MSDNHNQALIVDAYGNFELGNIADSGISHETEMGYVDSWSDPSIAKVERFRVIIDRSFEFYSVSYVYVTLRDGTKAKVGDVPWLKNYGNSEAAVRRSVVEAAKRDKVYAKGLGVFEALSILFG